MASSGIDTMEFCAVGSLLFSGGSTRQAALHVIGAGQGGGFDIPPSAKLRVGEESEREIWECEPKESFIEARNHVVMDESAEKKCAIFMWPRKRPLLAFVFRHAPTVKWTKLSDENEWEDIGVGTTDAFEKAWLGGEARVIFDEKTVSLDELKMTSTTANEIERIRRSIATTELIGIRRVSVPMLNLEDHDKAIDGNAEDISTDVQTSLSSSPFENRLLRSSYCIEGKIVNEAVEMCDLDNNLEATTGAKTASEHGRYATRKCYECHSIGKLPPVYKEKRQARFACPRIGQRDHLRKKIVEVGVRSKIAQSVVDFGVEACMCSSAFLDIIGSSAQRSDIDQDDVRVVVCNEQFDSSALTLDATIIVSQRDPTAPVKNRMAVTVRINLGVEREDDAEDDAVKESDCTILSHESNLHALTGPSPAPSCSDEQYLFASVHGGKTVQWGEDCEVAEDEKKKRKCKVLRRLLCGTGGGELPVVCERTTSLSSVLFYDGACVTQKMSAAQVEGVLELNTDTAQKIIENCAMVCEIEDPCERKDLRTTQEMLQEGLYVESVRRKACTEPNSVWDGVGSEACSWDEGLTYCTSDDDKSRSMEPDNTDFLEIQSAVSRRRRTHHSRRLRRGRNRRDRSQYRLEPPRFKQKTRSRSKDITTFAVKVNGGNMLSRNYDIFDVKLTISQLSRQNVAILELFEAKEDRVSYDNDRDRKYVIDLFNSKVAIARSTKEKHGKYNQIVIWNDEREFIFRHDDLGQCDKRHCVDENKFLKCRAFFLSVSQEAPLLPDDVNTATYNHDCSKAIKESTEHADNASENPESSSDKWNEPTEDENVAQNTVKPAKKDPVSPKTLRPLVRAAYDLWLNWSEERSRYAKLQTPCLPTPTVHDEDRLHGGTFADAVTPFGAYGRSSSVAYDDASFEDVLLRMNDDRKRDDETSSSLLTIDVDRFRGTTLQATGRCFSCTVETTDRGKSGLFGLSNTRAFDTMDLSCTSDVSEVARRRIFTPPAGMREQFESALLEASRGGIELKESGEKCDNDAECESGRCKRSRNRDSTCAESGTKSADEPCEKDSECLSAECTKGMFSRSGTCASPADRVLARRNQDLYSVVESLLRVVYRFAASREMIHTQKQDEAMPWYTSCDEYSLFARESGALSVYGGVLCSKHFMLDTKCVRWYVDRFIDAPETGEAAKQFRETIDDWDSQSQEMLRRKTGAGEEDDRHLEHLTTTKDHALHIQSLFPDDDMCEFSGARERASIRVIGEGSEMHGADAKTMNVVQPISGAGSTECYKMTTFMRDGPETSVRRLLRQSGECMNTKEPSFEERRTTLEDFAVRRAWDRACGGECENVQLIEKSGFYFPRTDQTAKFPELESPKDRYRTDFMEACAVYSRPLTEEHKVQGCWLKSKMQAFERRKIAPEDRVYREAPGRTPPQHAFIVSYPKAAEDIVNQLKHQSTKDRRIEKSPYSDCFADTTTLVEKFTKSKDSDFIKELECSKRDDAAALACRKSVEERLQTETRIRYAFEDEENNMRVRKALWCHFSIAKLRSLQEQGQGPLLEHFFGEKGESVESCSDRGDDTCCTSVDIPSTGGSIARPDGTHHKITVLFPDFTGSKCRRWYRSIDDWWRCVDFPSFYKVKFDMTCNQEVHSGKRCEKGDEESHCTRKQAVSAICGDLVTFDIPEALELRRATNNQMTRSVGRLQLDTPWHDGVHSYTFACFPKSVGYSNFMEEIGEASPTCADFEYVPGILYSSEKHEKSWGVYLGSNPKAFRKASLEENAEGEDSHEGNIFNLMCKSLTFQDDGGRTADQENALTALENMMNAGTCDLSPTIIFESVLESAEKVAELERRRSEIAKAYIYLAEKYFMHEMYLNDKEMESRRCDAAPPGFPS